MTTDDARGNGMAPWLRNAVMLTALIGWAATVAAYLLQGKLPDAPLLGVPGAVYLAMSPSLPTIGRKRSKGGDS